MHETRQRYVVLCQQLLVVATVLAVAVSATSVVSLDIVGPAPGPDGEPAAAASTQVALVSTEPVAPTVTETPLRGLERARPRVPTRREGAAGNAVETLAGVSDPQPVAGYATVGVTWDAAAAVGDDEIVVSVRSRVGADWSGWEAVEYHEEHGPDPGTVEARGSRSGTDPVVVGAVEEVQVRIETVDGTVPDGARLAVVDPGEPVAPQRQEAEIDTAALGAPVGPPAGPEPTSGPGPLSAGSTADGVLALRATPGYVTPRPRIFSRAQWGADERLRDPSSLRYHEVLAGFVHHTVNANGYTRAQVPSLLRGIYAYHTQSLGWSDIGYNFVVDRFGRVWEGRYGGVHRPVVGAHTLGYNEHSFAMSALGNFEVARAPAAMVDAFARLYAWKLALHGVRAWSSRQRVGSRTFPAISGHSDAGQTACPGRYLYARLPRIRSLAASYQRPFASRTRTADLAGTTWPDLVLRDRATKDAFVLRTGGQTGFWGRRTAATGFQGADLLVAAGDLDRDGRPDLVARDARTGMTGVHPGLRGGRIGSTPLSTRAVFRNADQMTGGVDIAGDATKDVVTRVGRRLWAYPGNGRGGFRRRVFLAGGWDRYSLTAGAGDLDGDGRHDLVAREGRDLYLVPGLGGRLGSRVRLPFAWGGYDQIAGVGDVTRDGRPDLVARSRKTRKLFVLPGDGQGGLGHRLGPFSGFEHLDFLAVNGNMRGIKSPDVLARTAGGAMVVIASNGRRNVAAVTRARTRLAGVDLALNVGDWDGDGHGDLVTRRARTGALHLLRGDGRGSFASPVTMATGWGAIRLVAAVGDMTGDGNPDLMGQPAGKAMRIYPGNGGIGFRASYVARSSIPGDAHVGVGLWNADGSPDTVTRRADGALRLHPGNGPGGLLAARLLDGAAGRYDWVQAIGDADGDGRPDLVGWDKRDGTLWLLPGAAGGVGPHRLLAEGMGRFDLAG